MSPSREPLLVVVLPALDEERTVAQVIEAIPRAIPGIGRVEALVVDDGSTDRTAELARQAGARVVMLRREGRGHPRGRGAGL